jgi:crotonobetaine/carnitine-CoA ligase
MSVNAGQNINRVYIIATALIPSQNLNAIYLQSHQGSTMPAPTALLPGLLHSFTGQDVPWLLKARSDSSPDKDFLVFAPFDRPARRWTYRDFHATVGRLAHSLALTEGQFVLLHMDNCIEFLLVWHACARAGAVVVTTNTRASADELAYFAQHSGARIAITQPCFEALLRSLPVAFDKLIVTSHDGGAEPDLARSAAAIQFEDMVAADLPSLEESTPQPMRQLSVQYTSGTTARPKGVVWTHANALWGARSNAASIGISADDVGHACLPLYHTNAICYSHLATLWAGATLVFQPRFSASRYWSCLLEHRCTWGVQIPFMLKALLGSPKPQGLALRRWGLGALNPALVRQVFGIPCIGWFGMTETVGLPIVSLHDLPGREMSMGLPAPGYEIAVRREDGADVAFEESGQLWIRGVAGLSMFLEYLNAPEVTDACFDASGWFATGDLVTPFGDGHIRFDGRQKDMLRIGAENVGEAEIERAIMSAGGIIEVAVVGKPDPMLDEVPVAFVIPIGPSEGLTERINAACARLLADFKRPREVFIVADLPRVTLGKIDKKLLRAQLAGATQ